METRIKPTAKGTSEPIKGKPGSFRIYFSLGRDPESGKNGKRVKYLKTPKRTIHCKSKNPKNWPSEVANALNAYRKELENYEPANDAPTTVAGYERISIGFGKIPSAPLSPSRGRDTTCGTYASYSATHPSPR